MYVYLQCDSFYQEIDTNSVNNQSDLILTNLTSSETSQKATEAQLLDNPVVTFLLEHLKINKPTVFAIGITTIGIIFLLCRCFYLVWLSRKK
ncbi:hypothetical protein HRD57_11875 [Tetragenococcus halophilus]|nr:hypothetical protein [Tetragenococcus halophilus]